MLDNPERNMKNEKCCSQLSIFFKRHVAFRKSDESLVCSDKTWQFLQTCNISFKNKYNFWVSYLSVCLSVYGSTVLLLDLCCFFSFLILYTVGRTPRTRYQLPTHRTTQTQNKRTQTSMSWMGFEPKIPEFERAKTVHALDRAATVIISESSMDE
jgi:hypothetical protein